MEYRRFGSEIVVRLDTGDEITEQLQTVAVKENVKLASVSGIGAVSEFTVGVFDLDDKRFVSKDFAGTYEIVSLTGNINTMNGEYYGHFHLAAGDREGHVFGGHMSRGVISATGEIFIHVIDGTVDRRKEEVNGINILKF